MFDINGPCQSGPWLLMTSGWICVLHHWIVCTQGLLCTVAVLTHRPCSKPITIPKY